MKKQTDKEVEVINCINCITNKAEEITFKDAVVTNRTEIKIRFVVLR